MNTFLLPSLALASTLCLPAGAATGHAPLPAAPVGSKASATPHAAPVKGQVRTSKTRLGVLMQYEVDSPATGTVGQVRLLMRRAEGSGPMTIELNPDAALALRDGLPGGHAVQTTGSASYTIGVLPQQDGLHYLHVYLRSGNMVESLAVPVQVGKNARLRHPAKVQTMPNGERVISMPAQQ